MLLHVSVKFSVIMNYHVLLETFLEDTLDPRTSCINRIS